MRILIIEDNSRHQQDARDFFAGMKGVEIVFLDSYDYFDRHFGSNPEPENVVDAVISDVFFPYSCGTRARPVEQRKLYDDWRMGQVEEPDASLTDPIGVLVMIKAKAAGIPCVLNTSIYHHATHLNWVCSIARHFDVPLVDGVWDKPTYEQLMSGHPAPKKDWGRAWQELLKEIAKEVKQ